MGSSEPACVLKHIEGVLELQSRTHYHGITNSEAPRHLLSRSMLLIMPRLLRPLVLKIEDLSIVHDHDVVRAFPASVVPALTHFAVFLHDVAAVDTTEGAEPRVFCTPPLIIPLLTDGPSAGEAICKHPVLVGRNGLVRIHLLLVLGAIGSVAMLWLGLQARRAHRSGPLRAGT